MVARPCPWFVENSGYRPDDIAIVGMAGRFPGADSVEALWSLLVNGAEGIRDLQAVAESAPDAATKASSRQRVKRSALLNDAYGFDAACFGLSASEALVMDPQQRLLLQCAWHALEAAACDPQRFSGDIACYVGIGSSQYLLDRILQRPDIVASIGEKTVQLGNDPAFAASQLAYRLGLRGAALTLNSACSTSLVGVQLACAALQRHECQLALVGGSQISRHHGQAYPVQSGGILSAQGRCRPFDASADGTISGSGCAVVALQTLKQAWTDRRRIIAVIKSVAVNNDGADKLGFTAPSVAGQAQVIRRAIKAANINAEDIAYHECHGTATPLGDPVEIAALAQAHNRLSPKRPAARPCYLGALKANVGHLAAAAGVSGLLKTALVLERAQIPPLAHFQQLNAALKPWPEFLNIPQQNHAWPQAQHDSEATPSPRYASVSAFGMGGTNAHAVLQEAPTQQQHQSQRQCYLLPVTARTPEALERLCDDLSEHIQTLDRTALAAVAHTLIHGRRRLACRCVLVVSAHAQSKQASGAPPRPFRIVRSAIGQHSENRETAKLALILPGQGSQSVGMGRSYYREEAAYREAVERCLSIVNRLDEPALDFDPKALLLGAASAEAEQRLWRTDAAQLLLFIHGYAMAQMWQHWGVHEWGSHDPALVGHSLGEYVAMVVAGELSLQQGLQLILRRGRAMAQAPVGAMLAVLASATQVQAELQRFSTEQASLNTPAIALLNSPQHIMVAGDVAAIDAFQIQLQQQGIAGKRLGSRHAFHTQAMAQAAQQVAADWEALVVSSAHCSAAECDLRVVANLTGTWMRKDEARDPEYWRRHTQEPVRFADNIQTLVDAGFDQLLDLSPSQGLAKLIPSVVNGVALQVLHSASANAVDEQGIEQALLSLGQLWCQGYPIDFEHLYQDEQAQAIALPLYPFETNHYELSAETEAETETRAHSRAQSSGTGAVSSVPVDNTFIDKAASGNVVTENVATENVVTDGNAPLSAYTPHWVPLKPSEYFANNTLVDTNSAWQLWGMPCALLEALQAQLHSAGCSFQHLTLTAEINAIAQAFLADLARHQRLCVVWVFTTDAELLRFSQALLGLPEAQRNRIDFIVLTQAAASVAGEMVNPQAAVVAVALKVLQQEGMQHCCTVDVDEYHLHNARALLLHAPGLLARQSSAWQALALRAGRWWQRAYSACGLNRQPSCDLPLQDQSTYLVTGARGGVGFVLCCALLQAARAQGVSIDLIGVSRTAWSAIQREQLEALLAVDSSLAYCTVDMGDANALHQHLLPHLHSAYPLRGVMHAAGITGGALCWRQSEAQMQAVMTAKYQSLLNLQCLLLKHQSDEFNNNDVLNKHSIYAWPGLDFVLLCSSLNALKGGVGRWDYAQANACLDAYAQAAHLHHAESPVVSVNWPAWLEQGMAARSATAAELKHRGAISNAQALAILPRLLVSNEAQIVLTQQSIEQALLSPALSAAEKSPPASTAQQTPHTQHATQRPAHLGEMVAAETAIQQRLCQLWQQLLAVDAVGINDDFFALGGHSLLLVQLGCLIEQQFAHRIEANDLFALLTVRELAAHIEQQASNTNQQGKAAITGGADTNVDASADTNGEAASLDAMLNALEQMSPDAVDALLGSYNDDITRPQGGVPGDEPGD